MTFYVDIWNRVKATTDEDEYTLTDLGDLREIQEVDVESYGIVDGDDDILISGLEEYEEAVLALEDFNGTSIIIQEI